MKGEALGWSSEFGFGLLKIADAGPWPHVKMNHRPKAGQVCVALGYARDTDHCHRDCKPDIQLGISHEIFSRSLVDGRLHRNQIQLLTLYSTCRWPSYWGCVRLPHAESVARCTYLPVRLCSLNIGMTWSPGKNLDRKRLLSRQRKK